MVNLIFDEAKRETDSTFLTCNFVCMWLNVMGLLYWTSLLYMFVVFSLVCDFFSLIKYVSAKLFIIYQDMHK